MTIGLVGRKVGMTRIFTEDGTTVPVTVLDVSDNRVTQIKTPEIDGYAAVQVAFGKRRATRVSKPLAGHFAKAGVEAGSILSEFHVDSGDLAKYQAGGLIGVDLFQVGQKVDVSGTTIGKGIISARTALLMVTPVRTIQQALSARTKTLAVYSQASAWLAIWVM
jgi:large subunit ribosomal protein L3